MEIPQSNFKLSKWDKIKTNKYLRSTNRWSASAFLMFSAVRSFNNCVYLCTEQVASPQMLEPEQREGVKNFKVT